jgi:hypothetical protein
MTRVALAAAGVTGCLALVGCAGGTAPGTARGAGAAASSPSASVPAPSPSASASPSASGGRAGTAPAYRSPRDFTAVAEPVRVRIPSIGVRSSLERLGRAKDGTVEVPRDFDRAGWYTGGFRPGQPGPAVLLGHVDSKKAPAVFYDLRRLKPDAVVLVDRADGTTARFRVTGVEQYRKTRFPSDLVYFPTLEPSLRLVTCGGSFDATSGHYRDNVIVLATAA